MPSSQLEACNLSYLIFKVIIYCPPEVGLLMRNPQSASQPAKQNRVFADLVGVAGGVYHDVRARGESLLGAGATDRRVLADLVAAPGG